MMIKKHRDVQLIEKDKDHYLAIACDVSAAIGAKPLDVVRLDTSVAAYHAAAVPLMEILSIGAVPISIINTLGAEMVPTGKRVIQGIQRAMVEAEIPVDCLTGSTEDNMPTETTTIGVTVVANLEKKYLEYYRPVVGDRVYVIGLPKMGQVYLKEEIIAGKGEVATLSLIRQLRTVEGIHHLLPVGSKGIGYELSVLLKGNALSLPEEATSLDLKASAGPSSCLIITCDASVESYLLNSVKQPITYIGTLREK